MASLPAGASLPGHRAPAVADFGPAGVRAAYHLVTEKASAGDLAAMRSKSRALGYFLFPAIVNFDGHATMFAVGPGVFRAQRAVDEEFRTACQLGGRHIYLTYVRYNPVVSGSKAVQVR